MIDQKETSVPSTTRLINPTLDAIHGLGGSAPIKDIFDRVVDDMGLSSEIATRKSENDRTSALERRLASARTVLKANNLIDNYDRGVWTLTSKGLDTKEIDATKAYSNYIANVNQLNSETGTEDTKLEDDLETASDDQSWRDALTATLCKMEPSKFEWLCRLLLLKSGFIDVKVTGRPGDRGIDGSGRIRLSGMVSFPVMFQCKRYEIGNNVVARDVRDFQGAVQGRAEKGLIITTSGFTSSANKEATRDGALPIDLIDGQDLADLLKKHRLGINVTERTVEDVAVDSEFFLKSEFQGG